MTNGNTNWPSTRTATSSQGLVRTVGTIIDQRTWSGGDAGTSGASSVSPQKVLRRTALALSLTDGVSRAARIEYLNDLESESLPKGPVKGPRVPRDYGEGTLGNFSPRLEVPVRNGFAPDSRKPKRLRRGGGENAYSCSRQRQVDVMMTWWQSAVGPVTDTTALLLTGSNYQNLGRNPVALLNANDDIRLVNKLRSHLDGSDFNMSVFLGEGHQTLKMIGDSAIKIARAGWHLRKGDLAGAAASLTQTASRAPVKRSRSRKGDLANNWLELQYGWLPLLNDVEEGAKSLAHHLNVPMRSTYRVKVERTIEGVAQPQPPLDVLVTDYHYHKKVLIAKVKEYDNSVPALLGLKDPELVAWELLPFSFVADWFVPIGSWLEARALSSKLTGTFITCDLKKYELRKVKSVKYGGSSPQYVKSQYDRTISSSINVRMPEYKGLAKAASWQHCTNAIALLTQVFTGQKVRKFD